MGFVSSGSLSLYPTASHFYLEAWKAKCVPCCEPCERPAGEGLGGIAWPCTEWQTCRSCWWRDRGCLRGRWHLVSYLFPLSFCIIQKMDVRGPFLGHHMPRPSVVGPLWDSIFIYKYHNLGGLTNGIFSFDCSGGWKAEMEVVVGRWGRICSQPLS